MWFGFINDLYNYEERKVSRFENSSLIIDTCAVSDGNQKYETAIKHPDYNDNGFITVEAYDTYEDAQNGHNKWVDIMTKDELPEELIDCCNAEIGEFYKNLGGKVIYKKGE